MSLLRLSLETAIRSRMTSDDISATIEKVVRHAPDWLRQDLASKEASVRERAEETLAAMIVGALKG